MLRLEEIQNLADIQQETLDMASYCEDEESDEYLSQADDIGIEIDMLRIANAAPLMGALGLLKEVD
jgi:hypothetical protein